MGPQAHMGVPKFPTARVCGQRVLHTQVRELTHSWPVRWVSVCTQHTRDQLQKAIEKFVAACYHFINGRCCGCLLYC